MTGTLYAGTSGWAYEEWRDGVFYPPGVTMPGMLRHYAGVFGSVEVNYTFRHLPGEAAVAGWREQTPEGFRFALKASRRITHMRRLVGTRDDVAAFTEQARALGDKLGPVLFQCPEGLEHDPAVLERFLDELPDGLMTAMEFRDPSFGEDARARIEERGIAWCVADTDEAAADLGRLGTAPFVYLRLRRTDYRDRDLKRWAAAIGDVLGSGRDVYCYLKHEDSGTGPRWASRLAELTGARV